MNITRIRNILLTIVFCFFITVPIANIALQKVLPESALSDCFDQSKVEYLSGGNSDSSLTGKINLGSFANGEMQTALENKIAFSAPGRYYVLLGYSSSQRFFIECSNLLFNFETYPARYTTNKLYIPSINALSDQPLRYTDENRDLLATTSNRLKELATDYPDKHFCVFVVDISNSSAAQPAATLASNTLSTSDAAQILRDGCAALDNMTVTDNSFLSLSAYYDYFYTSDHHWNGWGARAAYDQAISDITEDQAIDSSGLEIADPYEPVSGIEDIKENGSYSRSALLLLNEAANEPCIPLNSVIVESHTAFNGDSVDLPLVFYPNRVNETNANQIEFDFYRAWYSDLSSTITSNPSSSADASALIVGDSFTFSFKWIAATRFNQTTSFPDFHINVRETGLAVKSLREKINETDSDYIFIIAEPQCYIAAAKQLPHYFK